MGGIGGKEMGRVGFEGSGGKGGKDGMGRERKRGNESDMKGGI